MKKLLLIMTLVFATVFAAGCTKYVEVEVEVPSGDNCPENIAYLQSGVDAYYDENGSYPTDFDVLLEEGYIEEMFVCPGSGIEYIIVDGVVVEP